MSKKWILIIVFSLVAVFMWIGIEVYSGLSGEEVAPNYNQYLTSLQPSVDDETIDEILEREEEYLMMERDDLE